MTTLLATVADVKERLSGDVPSMSAAFDGDIAGCLAAVSAEIAREVGRARGYAPGSGWSFLAASVNEVQQVIISSGQTAPTGGTFTLTYSGQTTSALAYNATAAAVQAALIVLSNIGSGDVTVSGPNGGPYLVTFGGALTGPQSLLIGDGSSLVPAATLTVVEMVPGVVSQTVERIYRGRAGGVATIYIDDCVQVTAVAIYSVPGTLQQSLVVGTDVLVKPYQGLPITGLELVSGVWPTNPGGIGVTLRPGFGTSIPADAGNCAIIEAARAYLGARAGYNDAIGITPWGSLVTSKAFTSQTWAMIHGYQLYGSGLR